MLKEIMTAIARFTFNLLLFLVATVHIIIIAVPDASRPGAITASIAAALIIAMFDIGVFNIETDLYR